MTVPYTFANQSGNIPLAELDTNFANVKAAADTAGVVTANAQPNITSVGVLSGLSVSGNVTAGNVVANNFIGTFSGNISNAVYATTAGLATTANIVVLAAQTNITSVGILTGLSVSGNTASGNLLTGGYVSASGNLLTGGYVSASGNLLTGGYVSATGNLLTSGYVSATGNILGSNINASGLVTATGNIIGNYIVGNGSTLSSITAGNIVGTIANSTYAVTSGTVTTNAQPNITGVGTLSTLSVSGNLDVTGQLTHLGNISTVTISAAGNVFSAGRISATGALYGSNAVISNNLGATNITVGTVSVAGTVTVDNSVFAGNLFAYTGNILAANIRANLVMSATGNITGGNILTAGLISATGNITSGNLSVGTGNVNVGNVVFALDGSKFNSAKWTLVETINANLTSGNQAVDTTNSYSYYSTNYNEILCISSSGGGIGETIVIPVQAVTANSVWNINQQIGFSWANLSNANVTVVGFGGPYTSVSFTMYAR
jgi:hypothetical protein